MYRRSVFISALRSALILVSILVGTPLRAQQAATIDLVAETQRLMQETAADLAGFPRLLMKRTDVAPVIDGQLGDAVWQDAPAIGALTQVDPIEGAAPTEKTVVRLLYDRDHIYVAIRCFDSEPDLIIATQMVRDANLDPDDRVEMVFDTFLDRRNAFFFQINAVGAKGDALIENSGNFNKQWDGLWHGKAARDDKGWTAEIALPFQTISFDPKNTTWGFNFERFIRRKNEKCQWSSPTRNTGLFQIGEAGLLEAIQDIEQGLGLEFRPFLSLTYRSDQINDRDSLEFDPGADIFYKITPELTAAFTVNTDFAEAEVDERRVNLGRVPLFFPEKRDFFLQDAGIFAFGGIRSDPLPFFSRRIGRGRRGMPVDIIAGAKLTGRVRDLNIGLLDVQLAAQDDIEATNVAVGRLSLNVLEESTVGIIATTGNPRGNDENHLIGADFSFRNSSFLGDQVVTANAWVQKTFSEELSGDDYAYGLRFALPNDIWNFSAGASEVRANYNPALGFTRRFGRSIREYFFRARYRLRPQGRIRTLDFGISGFLITDLDHKLETGTLTFRFLELETNAEDRVELRYQVRGEYLESPFEISRGVVIPRGHYGFSRFELEFSSSPARPISIATEISIGGFYDGTRLDIGLELEWRASKHFFMSLEYEQNQIKLPQGDFTTRIFRARFNYYFTPDVSWTNFIQYDNVSDLAGINSRLRWIIEPGRELFAVVNQGFIVDHGLESASTEISLKIGWNFRF
ncbi:MAG: carbohydrate binding family 9 domain-containing protein [Planctomycetota bacterium]